MKHPIAIILQLSLAAIALFILGYYMVAGLCIGCVLPYFLLRQPKPSRI